MPSIETMKARMRVLSMYMFESEGTGYNETVQSYKQALEEAKRLIKVFEDKLVTLEQVRVVYAHDGDPQWLVFANPYGPGPEGRKPPAEFKGWWQWATSPQGAAALLERYNEIIASNTH